MTANANSPISNAMTSRQHAVLRALSQARGFTSAQSLHVEIRSSGERIGLATVYRALHTFVASEIAHTMHDADGTQLFSIAPANGLGYHLICRECRRHVPVSVGFVEDWAVHVASAHGYTDMELVIEVSGQCHTCAASTPRQQRSSSC
ncbi:Fur family transcriptional regulator [Saccharopolyspora mangrovi]|uniref:Transcriptional repressor n=1 Tax=Saccharopolyspora mangrovi TaxID=3082379 RepID=A0ABU6AHH1_9PSEU|nr:transcriptional repressor [Saccharopolyspora sp. S2-29]MEB3370938.1 transcriptional repressor [Saccharopolyspora sp. S2-29]